MSLWRATDIVLGWILLLAMVGVAYGLVGTAAYLVVRWLIGGPA